MRCCSNDLYRHFANSLSPHNFDLSAFVVQHPLQLTELSAPDFLKIDALLLIHYRSRCCKTDWTYLQPVALGTSTDLPVVIGTNMDWNERPLLAGYGSSLFPESRRSSDHFVSNQPFDLRHS